MKELKFRGMLRSGEWVYGGYVKTKKSGVHCILSGECDTFDIDGGIKNVLKFNAVKYKTVGEYTGFKDKNGKEIYEGDILKHDIKTFSPFVMEWINEEARFTDYAPRNTIEIIGNIYSDKELLNDKE